MSNKMSTQHSTLNTQPVPRHVAIIMDGNGRWARQRGLSRVEGHRCGYMALRDIVRSASDIGIEVLTVYAFSSENWKRPKEEVNALMMLFADAARHELPMMQENSVRLIVSGRFSELPEEVRQSLGEDMESTKDNSKLILNLALNYGSRNEIVDATRAIAAEVAEGKLTPDQIDDNVFSRHLYMPDLPDPDLLIRTASEMRVSNFLLWQIAYSEIWVTDTLWPDFTPETLAQAIADYQKRTRRFGKVVEEQTET